ncbi:NAD(P)-dependent oxidoreductase [Bacillus tuaregi]|uniref:NAD(P)-dependent oxidoreductase n=1 Tax=Bacillus tuaregi TaxID=1816695 RepID=UPI0008F8C595|nr:NAD(P)-dependent oxidoreductase [Bacillus tuaregi]
MKILISDYPECMMPTHELEIELLKKGLGNHIEVDVFSYYENNKEEFYEHLRDADALLTAFIQFDKEAFNHAPNLKVISLNSTGYDAVDIEEATFRGIGVCPVGEYCTQDVAEGTLAFMLALNKGHKHYITDVDQRARWDFASFKPSPRMETQTLGIFGFGKIGRCVASKAKHLCKKVIAYDPYVDKSLAADLGVELVSPEEIYKEADMITNHMNLNNSNIRFFDKKAFNSMEKKPIFINMGRGLSVDEDALVDALDKGKVRAAGLDILINETPDLNNHPLAHRENVIITPHASFYSTTSFEALQEISCWNIIHYLNGEKDKLFKLVN